MILSYQQQAIILTQNSVILLMIAELQFDHGKRYENRLQVEIPHEFLCPISQSIMQNPYITMDGYTYEGSNIEKWFETNDKSPITGLRIDKKIIQNRALREAIKFYKDEREKMKRAQEQRQIIIKAQTQQDIKKSYKKVNQNFPQILTNQGFLCPTKVLELCIKNIQIEKLLSQIKAGSASKEKRKRTSIERHLEQNGHTNVSFCPQKSSQKNILSSISTLVEKIDCFNKRGSTLNTKDLVWKKFNYLLLSCEEVKKIDFKKIKKEELRVSPIFCCDVEDLTMSDLIKRVKQINNIPEQYVIQVWKTSTPTNFLYQHIKKSLLTTRCHYANKVQMVGQPISDTSLRINGLGLGQDQYLIFQKGLDGNMVFKRNGNICQYCYNQRVEKIKCACLKYTYCSIECGLKDIPFHSKQCRSLNLVKI